MLVCRCDEGMSGVACNVTGSVDRGIVAIVQSPSGPWLLIVLSRASQLSSRASVELVRRHVRRHGCVKGRGSQRYVRDPVTFARHTHFDHSGRSASQPSDDTSCRLKLTCVFELLRAEVRGRTAFKSTTAACPNLEHGQPILSQECVREQAVDNGQHTFSRQVVFSMYAGNHIWRKACSCHDSVSSTNRQQKFPLLFRTARYFNDGDC